MERNKEASVAGTKGGKQERWQDSSEKQQEHCKQIRNKGSKERERRIAKNDGMKERKKHSKKGAKATAKIELD